MSKPRPTTPLFNQIFHPSIITIPLEQKTSAITPWFEIFSRRGRGERDIHQGNLGQSLNLFRYVNLSYVVKPRPAQASWFCFAELSDPWPSAKQNYPFSLFRRKKSWTSLLWANPKYYSPASQKPWTQGLPRSRLHFGLFSRKRRAVLLFSGASSRPPGLLR